MSPDDVNRRLVEEVKRRADDGQYIDAIEEREILEIAARQGISAESARAALSQLCEAQGYVLESRVLGEIKDLIETFAGDDGKIDEKRFNDAVTTLKKRCRGRRDDMQCKKMVVEVIEGNGYRVKEGLFNHWYGKVRKEVGQA
jgi:hypothetical protein